MNIFREGIWKFQSDLVSNKILRNEEQGKSHLILFNSIWSSPSKGRGKINSWFIKNELQLSGLSIMYNYMNKSIQLFQRKTTLILKHVHNYCSDYYVSNPGGSEVKNCLTGRRLEFNPWIGKIPWRRKWLPIPVFLPGKSYGQRSLVSCIHGVPKGLDIT